MSSHVSHGTCPIVPQTAPYKRADLGIVGFVWCRTQPYVPVKIFGHFCGSWPLYVTLRPVSYRPVGPHLHLPYITYHSSPHPFHNPACSFACMTLVAHLRHNIKFFCNLSKPAAFIHGPGHGFF